MGTDEIHLDKYYTPIEVENVAEFACRPVHIDVDGDAVIDVEDRTALYVRPSDLRYLADEIEEAEP